MLPPEQCLDRAQRAALEVVDRLVVQPGLGSLERFQQLDPATTRPDATAMSAASLTVAPADRATTSAATASATATAACRGLVGVPVVR